MKGRAVLLVLSILVAAVGTGLIYAYVHNADTRANRGKATIEIAIAAKPIPAGTSAKDVYREYLTYANVSQASMVRGAMTEAQVEKFQSAKATSRTSVKIAGKDPVLSQYFQDTSKPAAAVTKPGYVDVDVEVEGAAAGVGLLQVGQPTIVFVTLKGRQPQTKILFRRATVIGIDGVSGADDASGSQRAPTGSKGTVSLSVPLEDARKVALTHEYADQLALYFGFPDNTTGGTDEASMTDLRKAAEAG